MEDEGKKKQGGGVEKPLRIVLKKNFQEGLDILKSKDAPQVDMEKKDSNIKIIQ